LATGLEFGRIKPMINFKKQQFGNGLTLITAPLKDTEAVTVLVLVGVGSRYEEKGINGISHFLEHLFFKGTKKRPSTLKLSKELDALGARYNAFTSEESTGFFIQAAGQKFQKSWEILSDMILNPLIPEREVERERGVILEEMNMYYDTPQAYVGELSKRPVFGDSPLGRDIIGTREAIKSVTRNQIVKYRDDFYCPSNMLVVVAGNADGDWIKSIKSVLGTGKKEKTPDFKAADLSYKGETVNIHHKKTDQTHLVANVKTFPITDPRWYILEVLSNILGGQMSSRLFIKVRERRGLAYYIKAEPSNFFDTGLLSVAAGLRTASVGEALKVIWQEMKSLAAKPVGKEELRRAKDNLIGHLALSLEGSMQTAQFLAEQEFYEKKIIQPEEVIKRYERVTAADIQKLSQELFLRDNIFVTMIGPDGKGQKEKFTKIIK